MTWAVDQGSATVALLRSGLRGYSWHGLATEIWFAGDAVETWNALVGGDGLVPDPRKEAVLDQARRDVLAWQEHGLHLLTVLDPQYPGRLRDIREVPPFLFAEGHLAPDDRGMSVVGSRRASERGLQIARTAASLLVSKGLSVIAGLAAGIDTAAHRAALDAGGRTVAFIGTGITRAYPAQNQHLQAEIARHGLVLSQFWPDAAPTKASFPIRNAAMSGYGLATIVVEAGETSGTRIQARLALEHGRPVILTDMVTRTTTWGAALVGRPGVYVVAGASDLERAIDHVLHEQQSLARALDKVGAYAPTLA